MENVFFCQSLGGKNGIQQTGFFGLKIRIKSCLIRFENYILKYVIRFETCIPFNSRIVSAFIKIQFKHILLIWWRFTIPYALVLYHKFSYKLFGKNNPWWTYYHIILFYWAFLEFGTLLCFKVGYKWVWSITVI